jgi:hypothetical protein
MAARWQVSPLPRALPLPPPPTPDPGGSRLWREGIGAGVVRMPGMATHVVGGVMGYSGGEEAGDDVVMGAGPAAGPGWPRPGPSVTMWNDAQRASVHQRPGFAPVVDVPQGRPLRRRVALRLRLLHLIEPLAELGEIRRGLDTRHFPAQRMVG